MKMSQRQTGFTLVELMVAVAIISILATIGIPIYSSYVTNTKATECANEVAKIRLALVEYNARNFNYPLAADITAIENELGPDGYTPSPRLLTPASNCAISIGAGVDANSYTITVVGTNELLGIPNMVTTGP